MALKSLDELTQMVVAADATKTLFGKEQRGSSPTQHHPGSTPAFDTAGPGLGSRKAALNQIGRAERPQQRFVQSQACHRQRFFQSLFQTSCRASPTSRIRASKNRKSLQIKSSLSKVFTTPPWFPRLGDGDFRRGLLGQFQLQLLQQQALVRLRLRVAREDHFPAVGGG